jgi:hypothetical protein
MIINHTHQYVRARVQRDGKFYMYRCVHPHCTHREDKKFLEGKATLCNKCGTEFKLSFEDLRRSMPICMNCANTNKAKAYRAAKNAIADLFPQGVSE